MLRPYGELTAVGFVSAVAFGSRGHLFALLRHDRYVAPDGPGVSTLGAHGRRITAWGGVGRRGAAWGGDVLNGHKLAVDAEDRILMADRDAPSRPPACRRRRRRAGITGLSTAIHLAERGLDVVVLEAADAGFGGTGRNSGPIIPTIAAGDPDDLVARFGPERGERLVAFLRDGADVVRDVVRRYDIDCEAVMEGWALPAHRPSRLKLLGSKHAQWVRRQARAELWDRDRTRAMMGTDVYHGVLFLRAGGHVNPLALARGLGHALLRAGGRLYTDSPVTTLERLEREGSWRLATPAGEVAADKVVVATNAYTDALVPGLAKTLVKIVNYQTATHPLPDAERAGVLPSDIAASDSRRDLRPWRKDRWSRLVTGATLAWPVRMDRRIHGLVEAKIRETFPQIRDTRLEYAWSRRIAITPDRMPRVNELGPGCVTAIAYNGRGMALGEAVGRELAPWATGERGVDELSLPAAPVRPIPLRALVGRWAQLALLHYRGGDARDDRQRRPVGRRARRPLGDEVFAPRAAVRQRDPHAGRCERAGDRGAWSPSCTPCLPRGPCARRSHPSRAPPRRSAPRRRRRRRGARRGFRRPFRHNAVAKFP